VERNGKAYWTRIGVGLVNRDGSWNLLLDAIPINGKIQVREWQPRDDRSFGDHDGGMNGRRTSELRPSDMEAPLV
jgi:hypothetical protein